MGARGPRQKLDYLDRLDGRPAHRRKPPHSGVEATGRPQMPDGLPEAAQGCFLAIVDGMPGAYAAADAYLIAGFAVAWSLHRAAVEAMAASGAGDDHPMLRIANNSARTMASLGDRLGLDPKARARLVPPSDRPPSKFAGLMGSKGDRYDD